MHDNGFETRAEGDDFSAVVTGVDHLHYCRPLCTASLPIKFRGVGSKILNQVKNSGAQLDALSSLTCLFSSHKGEKPSRLYKSIPREERRSGLW